MACFDCCCVACWRSVPAVAARPARRHLRGTQAALVAAAGIGGGTTPPAVILPTVDASAVAVGTSALPLPEGWQTGAFMQVFVRSYQDSDGDGIGDLKGLISRLDYLQDLGIRGLWLMPVHPSQDRDHGYAVKEYRNVESQYGSLADLDALVTAAAARGIGVILDYVVNHSAADHPAFINARAAKDNAYRNWYLWQDTAPSTGTCLAATPGAKTPPAGTTPRSGAKCPTGTCACPRLKPSTTTTCAFGSTAVWRAFASMPWAC